MADSAIFIVSYYNDYFYTDIDECLLDTDDCDDDATCINFPGSYTCACLPGFRASGSDCIGL